MQTDKLRRRARIVSWCVHRIGYRASADELMLGHVVQVNKADSRFRHLMAAQLNAAAGESLHGGLAMPSSAPPEVKAAPAEQELRA